MKKYLKVMLILVVVLSLLGTVAFATANPFETAKNNATSQGTGNATTGYVNKVGGIVINVVQTIGYIVAVVMVLYVGIQWLIGTPAKKQELKGRMWSLVIGAILVAGGVTILGWIANIANTDLGVNTSSVTVRV